jgi:hypothetical protein
MRFRVTVSCAYEAETLEEALEVRREAHHLLEDALVDRTIVDPSPDSQLSEAGRSRPCDSGS